MKFKVKKQIIHVPTGTIYEEGSEVITDNIHEFDRPYYLVPVDLKEISNEIKERLEIIKEDLLDDGKLNYSNDPKKKSPGRKKVK